MVSAGSRFSQYRTTWQWQLRRSGVIHRDTYLPLTIKQNTEVYAAIGTLYKAKNLGRF